MLTFNVEYTDTFAGEANYSWVRRAQIESHEGISKHALMRRARKALGLTGVKGRVDDIGDTIRFRPHNMCTVMFITLEY